jgi:ABC-type multidrug transport system fused ATPase/permease subunit
VLRNKEMLDTSQRPSYLLAMVQQWLLLTMNIVVAFLALILVVIATQLRTVNPGSVGAGLVMLITFGTTLTQVINSYTGLETALGGISRLKKFSDTTDREDRPGEDAIPAPEWPLHGKIEIRGISASYSGEADDAVLLNMSLVIQPGEKVAVCGRTGRCVFYGLLASPSHFMCFVHPLR